MLSTLKATAAGALAALTVAGGVVLKKQILRPERARACFFIGSHTYYALPPDESVNADDNEKEPFKSHEDFVHTMLPDSVVTDFARALHEKEEHIFVSYSTFNSFTKLILRIEQAFAHYGVHQPLTQVSVDGPTIVSAALTNSRDYLATKQGLTPLSPAFSRVFHFLLALDDSQWDIYDTRKGLIYITLKKDATQEHAIDTHNFIKMGLSSVSLSSALSLSDRLQAYNPQTDLDNEHIWVDEMTDIIPAQKKTEWSFFFTGHGSPMLKDGKKLVERIKIQEGDRYLISQAVICGMRASQFKKVLIYLHTDLNTKRVFICSCYATAQRLLNLVASKIKVLDYELITPIATMIPSTQFVPRFEIDKYEMNQTTKKRHLQYHISDNKKPGIKKFSHLIEYSDKKTLMKSIDMVYSLKENHAISILNPQSNKAITVS